MTNLREISTAIIFILNILSTASPLPLSNILSSTGNDLKTQVTSHSADRSESKQYYPSLRTNNETFLNLLGQNMQRDAPGGVLTNRMSFPTARIVVSVMRRSTKYWEPWQLNRDVCPPSLCTSNSEKRPRGTADTVFYNGDIVLDSEYEKIIYGGNEFLRLRLRAKRATTRARSRKWKNGIVPYIFADTILPQSKRAINKAMKAIENSTCIRFRKKKLRDIDFVRYISEPGCWSSVGRLGGEQRLSMGRGCERVGIAVHEIAHALGLWHEQARPDRDKYIKVLHENISPRYLPDFAKANKSLVTSIGYPYDYESVMHYSKKAFTNLGDVTIEVIGVGKKLNMTIGQRDALSTIDIAQLRDMYNCNDKEDKNATLCPKGWKKRNRFCYKFEDKTKEQFAGAVKHCEDLNSRLLFIDSEKENKMIRKVLKSKYPNITTWRTAGRLLNGTFAWYTRENKEPEPMTYTNWAKGMPGPFSSMVIVRNVTTNKLKWEGAWLGSFKQMPEHAYNFICERRARRKCINGTHTDGRDYRGNMDHTIDGITCQKWSSIYPHRHKLLSYPFEEEKDKQNHNGLGDHNYCRNPSGARRTRPWCYTTKKNYKWQYCDISICSGKKRNPEEQTNKAGLRDLSMEADEAYKGAGVDGKDRKANRTDRMNTRGQSHSRTNNRRGSGNRDKNSTKKGGRKNRTEKANKDKNSQSVKRNRDNKINGNNKRGNKVNVNRRTSNNKNNRRRG